MTSSSQTYIQPRIETARLALDPPSEKDDVAMGAMFSDLETMAYLRFKTKEESGGWTLPDIIERRETQCKAIAEGRGSTFYIHDKTTGELAGVMGANTIDLVARNAVVGIILWKKYWSGGYGTEALYELMRGLFDDLNMHKIAYETTEPNTGMRKFLEQTCGVQLEYIRRDEFMCPATHKWVNLWQYEIFEDDWPRIKAALLEKIKLGAAKHASTS
ncbi:hypothetical protein BG011_004205 [Mortierella polycephala]|uniref:N-acetyltransferase domain-containing protein n=1 Tax=Mortierella polycephala TaxID=41804 RepID=A0A9P6Q274_9FUNG|nr:hypothetical protein BG011_004205 [Mortierella polycephala]